MKVLRKIGKAAYLDNIPSDFWKTHYCIRSSSSSFAQAFPRTFSAESGLVWCRQSFLRQCSASFQHLADRVRCIIRGPFVLDMHQFWANINSIFTSHSHFRGTGVLEGDIMRWRRMLSDIAVIGPVDKNKSIISFCCPRGWQNRCFNLAILRGNAVFDYPGERAFEKALDVLQTNTAYSGVRVVPPSRHVFGVFQGWVKESGVHTKMRPLGSYCSHACKPLYSLACRVLNHMVCKLGGHHAVHDVFSVVDKFHNMNVSTHDRARRGWVGRAHTYKRDIESFFNNVDRGLILVAWQWCLSEWVARFGSRRKVICIPRDCARHFRRQRSVSSRSFHGFSRNIMPAKSDRSIPRVQQARVATHDHFVLHVDDMEGILLFDMLWGYLLFGSVLFRPANGMAQGSPLSPGVCSLVCCYLENLCSSVPPSVPGIHIDRVVCRWVDDMFICILVCCWQRTRA